MYVLTLCLLVCFFLTSWFLNTVRIVFGFYLMKSARCNGRNVVLSFSLINILRLLYLLKFYLPLILPEEQMNFKLSNIPGNSVYINYNEINVCSINLCFALDGYWLYDVSIVL